MLEPATRKWEDQSDLKRFKFVFFCDCCQKAIPSPEYNFKSGFRAKIFMTESERRARELIWQKDHDAAYERANLYMFSEHIHTCEVCGAHICSDCAVYCAELEGGICCKPCLQEKGYHNI